MKTFYIIRRKDNGRVLTAYDEVVLFDDEQTARVQLEETQRAFYNQTGEMIRFEVVPVDLVPRW